MRIVPSSNTIKKHGFPWVLNNDTKQTKYIDDNKLKKDKKNTQLNNFIPS